MREDRSRDEIQDDQIFQTVVEASMRNNLASLFAQIDALIAQDKGHYRTPLP